MARILSRRRFLLLSGALLPLATRAQAAGVVHELSGEVRLNGFAMDVNSALAPGQTLTTGADGRVWFSFGGDAFFLRPGSRLRLEAARPSEPLIDFLRLFSGALGATFARGQRRSLVTPTATIGIRGTGVYLETSRDETYACTCFGAVEITSPATGAMMGSVSVQTENHQARSIDRATQIEPAPFVRHTNAEMIRLESLVGRPDPFVR